MLAMVQNDWPSIPYIVGPGAGMGPDAPPEAVEAVARYMCAAASPSAVYAYEVMNGQIDTRPILPAIQDPIQKSDPRIVFCVAWARGGYLPTHNPNYRLPQGKDPVWNNANCRNRRLFTDRAVKKIAASTKPFMLQTYRRDMGGGNFVLMKDLSSPIFVQGRHWGAFRMGFRQS